MTIAYRDGIMAAAALREPRGETARSGVHKRDGFLIGLVGSIVPLDAEFDNWFFQTTPTGTPMYRQGFLPPPKNHWLFTALVVHPSGSIVRVTSRGEFESVGQHYAAAGLLSAPAVTRMKDGADAVTALVAVAEGRAVTRVSTDEKEFVQ